MSLTCHTQIQNGFVVLIEKTSRKLQIKIVFLVLDWLTGVGNVMAKRKTSQKS